MAEHVQYYFPTEVFLEKDSLHKIGPMLKKYGDRALLFNVQSENSNPDGMAMIKTSLERASVGCIIYDDIGSKPGLGEIDTAVHFIKQSRANLIIAYGSRDSFYAARMVAMLATNEIFSKDLYDAEFPLKKNPLPIVTVPIGPCMGEEVAPIMSIYDKKEDFFFQHQDKRLFSKLVFIDPQLSESLTDNELASSGVAAIASSMESVLSKNSSEVSSTLAIRSVELIHKNLIPLINESGGQNARYNISIASLLAGMSHSVTEMGLCYSIASATNDLTGINFFLAMAIIIPHIMEYNLTSSAGRFVQIARAMDQDTHDITVIEAAIKAVEGLRKIYMELKLPQRLSEFEIERSVLTDISRLAVQSPYIKNTPREVDAKEIEAILVSCY